ncbi:MAG: HAMP domain-containing histidine kinase [Tannerella sp.]|jgi:signal transduction histidine kinase|nr:HAMP domain-containing histidine kinase [Tannerella sp.]
MTEKRLAWRYTYLAIGTVAALSLAFYLLMGAFPRQLWPLRLWVLLAYLLLCGIDLWIVGRRYARALLQWTERAYQNEKAFVSNASHEMNNPLTAIQGECEISLMKERSPAEYQAALGRIEVESERVIRLMKQLMFLAKGEDEILKAAREPIVLADFLMQFMEKRIQFQPADFSFEVEANPELLRTALGNIIGNALKYSGDKWVELHLEGHVLEVRDQGIGIPAEEQERVLQPFYRAANARDYAGSGIGLSLALHILRIYGAELRLSSRPGKGTTVRIDFRAL